MSPTRPPDSSRPPKISPYRFTTHSRPIVENPSADWIRGRAMVTMVVPISTISWEMAMTSRAKPRRLWPAFPARR
jgi:hypothetical protein